MEEQLNARPVKTSHKWLWWIGVVLLVAIILLAGLIWKQNHKSKSDSGEYSEENNGEGEFDKGNLDLPGSSTKTIFDYFPVHLEDFAVPAKMYGLWPYGVRGNDSSSHNEGHPGWDFEMKKGSKVYAVADLQIEQIHEGDHSGEGVKPQVIEAYTKLKDGKYHIVYHSVINLEPGVKEGAVIKAGEPLAEVGMPLSDTAAMIHFGIFPPNDSVGSCPADYFSPVLQKTIADVLAISIDQNTNKPFASACIGKISREIYLQNYPDRAKDLRGAEPFE